jgi:hypothetical protein
LLKELHNELPNTNTTIIGEDMIKEFFNHTTDDIPANKKIRRVLCNMTWLNDILRGVAGCPR